MPETNPAALDALRQATDGLLLQSEIDAPMTPFFWPSDSTAKLTREELAQLAKATPDAAIKTVKLESFFREATEEQDWFNEEERAQAERFRALVKMIKDTLSSVQVFRVGETKIDVYIVGGVEGGYAGLKTQVVET